MNCYRARIDEGRYTPVTRGQAQARRRKFKIRKNDVYTVGRAAANKGYDLLIRSLPELREQVPDARLQLAVGAGSGPPLVALELLVARMKKQFMDVMRATKTDHFVGTDHFFSRVASIASPWNR